jgi:guanosine-3',5'-bis(diphosphate) 3'-pyrophosphohydrolase
MHFSSLGNASLASSRTLSIRGIASFSEWKCEPETAITRDTIQAVMSKVPTPKQTLESARALAVASHGEQLYADEPYERHLEEVVRVLVSNGADPGIPAHLDVLCAAWLHDTLEDTDLDPAIIEAEFGMKVLEIVQAVTDQPGTNRHERHRATYPRIAELEPAVCVKLADRIATIERSSRLAGRMLRKCLVEHAYFVETLEQSPQWTLTRTLWVTYRAAVVKGERLLVQNENHKDAGLNLQP